MAPLAVPVRALIAKFLASANLSQLSTRSRMSASSSPVGTASAGGAPLVMRPAARTA